MPARFPVSEPPGQTRARPLSSARSAIGSGQACAKDRRSCYSAPRRRRAGADRGDRSGGARHRCRRLVRRRNPRHLARLYRGTRIWRPARPAQGTREERDRLLADAEIILGGWPFPLDLRARAPRLKWFHQRPAGASNLRSRRSVGQRCHRNHLARRRQHAGDRGICRRRHPVLREMLQSRSLSIARPARSIIAPTARCCSTARRPVSSAPAVSATMSAGSAPALGMRVVGTRRTPQPGEPLADRVCRDRRPPRISTAFCRQRFCRDLLPMDAGNRPAVRCRALCR